MLLHQYILAPSFWQILQYKINFDVNLMSLFWGSKYPSSTPSQSPDTQFHRSGYLLWIASFQFKQNMKQNTFPSMLILSLFLLILLLLQVCTFYSILETSIFLSSHFRIWHYFWSYNIQKIRSSFLCSNTKQQDRELNLYFWKPRTRSSD